MTEGPLRARPRRLMARRINKTKRKPKSPCEEPVREVLVSHNNSVVTMKPELARRCKKRLECVGLDAGRNSTASMPELLEISICYVMNLAHI